MFYVYILQDKRKLNIYTGSTNDLRRRLLEHRKRNKDWNIIYYEAYRVEKDAREREQKLKYHGTSFANLKRRIHYSFYSK